MFDHDTEKTHFHRQRILVERERYVERSIGVCVQTCDEGNSVDGGGGEVDGALDFSRATILFSRYSCNPNTTRKILVKTIGMMR